MAPTSAGDRLRLGRRRCCSQDTAESPDFGDARSFCEFKRVMDELMNEQGADGFQSDPLHKTPEQQKKLQEPPGEISLFSCFPCSYTSPRVFGQSSRQGMASGDLQQCRHCHALLAQEIKETFPREHGCDEQVISALHPHSS